MAFREFQKNSRETVRITPSVYEGHELIDVRVYAKNRDTNEMGPTKKGISLNVDRIPDLIEALTWAIGQPCQAEPSAPERKLHAETLDRLALLTWELLRKHGSAIHWDSAEKMVLTKDSDYTKWDLHFVLATRKDLFDSVGQGCFRARPRSISRG